MRKFTNPLDNIRVASPCSADWNQMYGNERRRFCGDCMLNVYNLSDMTRDEAEKFLMASEGRVCVRFFRRGDGTVLTKNCPVGWRAVKRRVSRITTAAFSAFVGLFTGVLGFSFFGRNVVPSDRYQQVMGDIAVFPVTQGEIPLATLDQDRFANEGHYVVGALPAREYEVPKRGGKKRK